MFLFFQQFEPQNVHVLFLYAIYTKLYNFQTFSEQSTKFGGDTTMHMYIVQHSISYCWSLLVHAFFIFFYKNNFLFTLSFRNVPAFRLNVIYGGFKE